MKAWLISLSATILLFILFEILLTESSTKKYIQGILRVILLIVIINPIVLLVSNEDILRELSTDVGIPTNISEENNAQTNQVIWAEMENRIEKKLLQSGIEGNVSIEEEENTIRSIKITVKKTGINTDESNIYTTANIKRLTMEVVNVEEDRIYVYGTT